VLVSLFLPVACLPSPTSTGQPASQIRPFRTLNEANTSSAAIKTTTFSTCSTKMPSVRRVKVFGLLVFIGVITLLFYTASLRQSRTSDPRTLNDFYKNTVNGLNRQSGSSPDIPHERGAAKAGGYGEGEDEEVAQQMSQRLKEAAKKAKANANAKSPKPDPPSAVNGVGSAAEGAGIGRKRTGEREGQQKLGVETKEEHEVEVELNSILKKSPIIIFSKSYCPHSRRAKSILLDKYIIEPKPYVVELDLHPLGLSLQARLAELTGRRTVPNTLINGVSIGGGDDVAELDERGTLVGKVRDLGGRRMVDVRERPVDNKGLR